MGDALRWLEEGFDQEFQAIVTSQPGLKHQIEALEDQEAAELGRRGARELLAPLIWREVTGDVLDTAQVTELLQISRQAVAKRVRYRSLLAVAGRGTTYFPVWQFDLNERSVRPVVKEVLAEFSDALGEVDPLVVVSWARSPQHEDLDGMTPQEWIEKGLEDEALRVAARRAAASLAE